MIVSSSCTPGHCLPCTHQRAGLHAGWKQACRRAVDPTVPPEGGNGVSLCCNPCNDFVEFRCGAADRPETYKSAHSGRSVWGKPSLHLQVTIIHTHGMSVSSNSLFVASYTMARYTSYMIRCYCRGNGACYVHTHTHENIVLDVACVYYNALL